MYVHLAFRTIRRKIRRKNSLKKFVEKNSSKKFVEKIEKIHTIGTKVKKKALEF